MNKLIKDEVLDVNLKFYRYLKNLNSTNGLGENQRNELKNIISRFETDDYDAIMNRIYDFLNTLSDNNKYMTFEELLSLLDIEPSPAS